MGKAVAKKTQVLSPEEEKADQAREVEQKIVSGCTAIRAGWFALSAFLYEFHKEKMWEALGWEKFDEWLGSPDISLARSHVYALIDVYRELVVERGLNIEKLHGLEVTKLQQVLPMLKAEQVDLDVALADVESLSRLDLREKYGNKKSVASRPLVECEQCGLMRQPVDNG